MDTRPEGIYDILMASRMSYICIIYVQFKFSWCVQWVWRTKIWVKQNMFCVKSKFNEVTKEFHYDLMSF